MLFADGATAFLNESVEDAVLAALAAKADGNAVSQCQRAARTSEMNSCRSFIRWRGRCDVTAHPWQLGKSFSKG